MSFAGLQLLYFLQSALSQHDRFVECEHRLDDHRGGCQFHRIDLFIRFLRFPL